MIPQTGDRRFGEPHDLFGIVSADCAVTVDAGAYSVPSQLTGESRGRRRQAATSASTTVATS